MNWKDAFREEFGIHFEGCKGELDFAIQFIEELLEKAIKKEFKRIQKTRMDMEIFLEKEH